MAQIPTYFCAKAIFKVPSSNAFPTSQKIDFKKFLVTQVPKGVKLPKLLESFRRFCSLVHLANIFTTVKIFFIHPV